MKKTKRNLLIALIVIIILIAIGFISYKILKDPARLTTEEKQWIASNTSNVQNINIINNVDVLGKNGKGVFYDFIEDLKQEHNLTINPITYDATETTGENSFKIKSEIDDNDLVFFEGHYVLLGKTTNCIGSIEELKGYNIGILKSDETRLKEYSKTDLKFETFETLDELTKKYSETDDINYIILPQQQYLSTILTKSYEIIYHFSDLKNYYVYDMPNEYDAFSSIISKFFIEWQTEHLNQSIAENTLNAFIENLNITQKELATMQSKVYSYGFINNSPYEVITGGNYGGIVSEYLRQFSEMSNIEFEFRKYNSVDDFNKAISKNDLNMYFNYYDIQNEFKEIPTHIYLNFNIIAPSKNDLTIKSLTSLKNQTVYVLADSKLKAHLESINGINIKTYNNEKELKQIAKSNHIIAIDSLNFDYYYTNILRNYSIRYNENTTTNYGFKIEGEDAFALLFSRYISTLDADIIITNGLYNHEMTLAKGSTMGKVAKYTLMSFAALAFIAIIWYRSTKRIRLATKIKKEDKIKFIDQLTSLKNRNYLNENINNWNKNTIYPQSTIIVDLNNLQEINDTLGYEHGDNQIKAAANILIKTQLDNSDIIRTDGNEFLIYLVGYQEKQIVSYIRKLYKEFKNLPYEHGAAIGYSMITDDIKTLEDSINESVEDMRTKKEEILED